MIYILFDKNDVKSSWAKTKCVSEDIYLIRKHLCNSTLFPSDTAHPILEIWQYGEQIAKYEGPDVLLAVARIITK